VTDVGKPPTKDVITSGVETMTITLGQGTVTAKLDPSKAPCTVNSMRFLAGKKFFDNTACVRVTDSILQCGDPAGTGSGGPAYRFPNENVPSPTAPSAAPAASAAPSTSASAGPSAAPPTTALYPAGTLAMAHSSQADSNSSQFFLVFKDVEYPADYTIFGTITGGLDVLQKIGAAGNDGSNQAGGGKPTQEVKISSLTVTDIAPAASEPVPATSGSAPASAAPSASVPSNS
jgi:peptidyl-prolyl cis-trans isomerase B (cyclophilin B)